MAGRRDDETNTAPVTILKTDNERLKEICEESLERASVVYLVRLMIRYGIEHIDDVLAWYGVRGKKAIEGMPTGRKP
jgi:hypothetical protein